MNEKQFKKNIRWINKMLSEKYPGASLNFPIDGDPNIHIQDNQKSQMNEIVEYTQNLIRECGGEAEFYTEKAYRE